MTWQWPSSKWAMSHCPLWHIQDLQATSISMHHLLPLHYVPGLVGIWAGGPCFSHTGLLSALYTSCSFLSSRLYTKCTFCLVNFWALYIPHDPSWLWPSVLCTLKLFLVSPDREDHCLLNQGCMLYVSSISSQWFLYRHASFYLPASEMSGPTVCMCVWTHVCFYPSTNKGMSLWTW